MATVFKSALSSRVAQRILDFEGVEPIPFPQSLETIQISTGDDNSQFVPIGQLIKGWSLDAELAWIAKGPASVSPQNDATETEVVPIGLTWIGEKWKILRTAIQLHESNRSLTGFLIASSIVDRSLGDVVSSKSGSQVPFLLKDLLLRPELEALFGLRMIAILRTFIGPPSGMNLRNVLWHGFSTEAELPRCYFPYLITLMQEIGTKLQEDSAEIVARPLLSYSDYYCGSGLGDLSFLRKKDNFGAILGVFSTSQFIVPSTEVDWARLLLDYQDGQYYQFVCGTLPMMEHGLRRVYSTVNNSPEKVYTANPDVFYTTLDEILAETTEGGGPNQMIESLGVPITELLNDIFMLQTGPRLRDRVSHGEADPWSFSSNLMDHYLLLLLVLSAKYRGPRVPGDVGIFATALPFPVDLDSEKIDSLTAHCQALAGGYRAQYHPITQAKDSTAKLMEEVVNLVAFLKSREIIEPNSLAGPSDLASQSLMEIEEKLRAFFPGEACPLFGITLVFDKAAEDHASAIRSFREAKVDTMFRSAKSMRVSVLVNKILEETHSFVNDLRAKVELLSEMLAMRKMGSHQRKNFVSLVEYSRIIVHTSVLCSAIAEGALRTASFKGDDEIAEGEKSPVDDRANARLEDKLRRDPLLKLLKAVLTSVERNRANVRDNHWTKIGEEFHAVVAPHFNPNKK